jgi:hypothetical protein
MSIQYQKKFYFENNKLKKLNLFDQNDGNIPYQFLG